ncbi:MAG: M48 family metallopeptidase [Motiliproteus sp.]
MRLRQNPKIPEGINASPDNPLKEFLLLLAGITLSVIALVTLISLLAQSLAPLIPFSWEQRLTGLYEGSYGDSNTETKDKSSEQSPPKDKLPDSPAFINAELALQELSARLSNNIDRPENMVFNVHLIEQPLPNAFATLGGHIFVTTGLLRKVGSENALAMVLAHEMAHIKHRHPIQAISRGALVQFLMTLVLGNQGTAAIQSVLGQTGLLTLLSFNRDMEREADQEAMAVLVNNYGHLAGADEFFSQLLEQGNQAAWTAIFQTHPGVESRVVEIRKRAKDYATQRIAPVPLDQRLISYLQPSAE